MSPRHFLTSTTNELAQEGFTPVAHLLLPHAASHATPVVVLLIDRQTSDKALISVITRTRTSRRRSPPKMASHHAVRDDSSVGTRNTKSLPAYYKPLHRRLFRFPDVTDARRLYALHRALRQKYAPNLKPVLPPQRP